MATEDTVKVLVYSDDKSVREQVIAAVGRRAAHGLPIIEWEEVATATIAQDKVHNNFYGAVILDAEATKISGTVLAKTLALEEDHVPPIIMLVARPQDAWLSGWSGAAITVERPLNPIKLQEALAQVLK